MHFINIAYLKADKNHTSKETIKINVDTKNGSKLGKLIDGKHPIYGPNPIEEIKGRGGNVLKLCLSNIKY